MSLVPSNGGDRGGATRVGTEARISEAALRSAVDCVQSCDARRLLVPRHALRDEWTSLPDAVRDRVVWLVRGRAEADLEPASIRFPDVALTRMGQVKMAVFRLLARRMVGRGDVVVCVSGESGAGTLDTISLVHVDEELESYAACSGEELLPPDVLPEVVDRVVDLATELGSCGREGKPVGALFVVGDVERLRRHFHQLILNPFAAHPEHGRNIQDPDLEETVKELSTLDGAFIVRSDGVIESCGTHLVVPGNWECDLAGLGTRHHAGAAISEVADAVAIVVSESTGDVTIFRNGHVVTRIKGARTIRRVFD